MARSVGIDRAQVITTAATLADEHGLDQLTLALVASRLGVRLPSLYNHVAGLPGLRRDLALLGLRDLARQLNQAAIGKAGDDALQALGLAYRTFARTHPGLYAATIRAPAADDQEWQAAGTEVVTIVLAVLAGYQLADDDALHAVRAFRSVVHGFVALEASGGFGLPLDLDESYRRLLHGFIVGLRQTVEQQALS